MAWKQESFEYEPERQNYCRQNNGIGRNLNKKWGVTDNEEVGGECELGIKQVVRAQNRRAQI